MLYRCNGNVVRFYAAQSVHFIKGVATKFWWGGGYGHLDPPTPKISFSSDFGHFILGKNIGKCKILILVKKVTENFISGERPPLIYRQRRRVPVPCLPV